MMSSGPSTRSANRHRYRRLDGRQTSGQLSADDLLELLGDELLDGNVDLVLSQTLHQGIDSELPGLDGLRERLSEESRKLDESVSSEALQQLSDALAAEAKRQGTPLPPSATSLLQALASSPGNLARTLSEAGDVARLALEEALDSSPRFGGRSGGISDDEIQQQVVSLREALELALLSDQIKQVRTITDVNAIDDELIRDALGQETAASFNELASSLEALTDSGYLRKSSQGWRLSPRAIQHIGNQLLRQIFQELRSRSGGEHPDVRSQAAIERSGSSRDYEFGAPFDLNLSETILNAVKRGGSPVRLQVDDMSIFDREETSRVATVIAIDLSRSMGDRGYLLAAKKLALTLSTLVQRRFPRDQLHILGFSEQARIIEPAELADLAWDRFGLGTNIQDALRSARRLLGQYNDLQKNLILITDGEPTAYTDQAGEVQFSQPPTEAALAATYAEAVACKRERITMLVAQLSSDASASAFAAELVRHGGGNLVITDPASLSSQTVLAYGRGRSSLG